MDSLNPASAVFAVARLGGVMGAVSAPKGGLVSGQSAFVTSDGAIRNATLAMHINLGLAGREAVSGSRARVLERLREVLFDAREYGRRKADFDRLNSRGDSAALLRTAGVQVLFSVLGEPAMVRTLAQEAGNAVAWGLPHTDALRAVTQDVAAAFGLDGGRLAPGAPADLVLWNGDPLELSSRPVGMWLAGKQVPLTSRQQALFDKYKALTKECVTPEKVSGRPPGEEDGRRAFRLPGWGQSPE